MKKIDKDNWNMMAKNIKTGEIYWVSDIHVGISVTVQATKATNSCISCKDRCWVPIWDWKDVELFEK